MLAGDIDVKLIPKDATEATLVFKNKTKKPLAIRLPEAAAGVPVLAQIGFPGGLRPRGGFGPGAGLGPGGGAGNQGFGFGAGLGVGAGNQGFGNGFGNGLMGGRRGFFNVAPEKVGKLKVPAVCLEHGKRDPNPRVAYKIVPIDSFTDKPEVVQLVKMLGHLGPKYQNAIQAAAWNAQNGLSWEQLARKNKVQLRNRYTEKWFSYQELAFARRALAVSVKWANDNPTPSKVTSIGQ